jgi:hypothetical protein
MNVCYKITYPPALTAMCQDNFMAPKYSKGWYGTCSGAPPAVQIDLYNDVEGFCLAQFPIGPTARPSGLQDGTTLTVMTQTAYNTLLAQYVAQTTDGSNGIWAGTVLAGRDWNWQPPEPIQRDSIVGKILEARNG